MDQGPFGRARSARNNYLFPDQKMKHMVSMPMGGYMSEHKRLIKLMEHSKSPKMLAEAKRQKAEVAAMLKKRTGARM